MNALKYGMSLTIPLNDRTMSVQCSRQLLEGGVDLRVWDFAGEVLAVALALRCRRSDLPLLF
jgi:hypothetical protein